MRLDILITAKELVKSRSIASDLIKKGLVKVDEEINRRQRGMDFSKSWGDFNFCGNFIHSGFGKFSTQNCYNLISDGQNPDKEIILARPLSGQSYYVEFSRMDLPSMTMIKR